MNEMQDRWGGEGGARDDNERSKIDGYVKNTNRGPRVG